jgi:hypothetical protein
MKRMVSNLTEPDESALFRASQFPSCLLHAEADLKGKKPFKDATLRTNVASACGLALVRCGEMAFSSLGKDSTLMSCLHDAIAGDTPQDIVLKDTRKDLIDIRKGFGKVANVGLAIAAGSFNQGIEDLRHLVCESPSAKSVRPTLELCPPSLTHLFGDKVHIREALESDRRRPYQAGSFHSKPIQPSLLRFPGGMGSEEETREEVQVNLSQARGKSQRPCLQEVGGPEEAVSPSRETGEVVPGLVSPAQTPRSATTPF